MPDEKITETDEDRAKQMFGAYNEQGPNPWKTFDGRDVPKWDELNDQVRAKWTAAAAKAREIFDGDAVAVRLQHLRTREHQIMDLCSLVGVAAEEELEPAIKRLVERQDNTEELEERMAAKGVVPLTGAPIERVTDTRDIERVRKDPHHHRRTLGRATFKAMYPDIAARLERDESDGR